MKPDDPEHPAWPGPVGSVPLSPEKCGQVFDNLVGLMNECRSSQGAETDAPTGAGEANILPRKPIPRLSHSSHTDPGKSKNSAAHRMRSCCAMSRPSAHYYPATNAGRRLRQGVAFSYASPTPNSNASWNGLATTWIDTGNPPAP